jgi:hypothetical protein
MDPERPTYWDLLEDIARLQTQNAQSFAAWAAAYRAAGEAAAATAETLETMAHLGRRAESFWSQAPQATVAQALQLMTQPWQAMGVPFASFPGSMAARLWEAWRTGQSDSGDDPPAAGG